MIDSIDNHARINTLIEKLRHRLKNFAVINLQGEQLGEVKDLILDTNRQLCLVVSQVVTAQNSQGLLIVSKLIKKIEPANRAIFVDIKKAETANLPEYLVPVTADKKLSDSTNPISPAPEVLIEGTNQDMHRLHDTSSVSEPTDFKPSPSFELPDMQNREVPEKINLDDSKDTDNLGEEIIRLLEERVVVERNKRKVGEVIVRKEIETRMVEVPIRYEKLIVEQVSPEHKQLAEINLGQETISQGTLPETVVAATQTTSTDPTRTSLNSGLTISGNFSSPKIASLLLNAIALERQHGCKQVRVEIVVEDAERQKTYQEWFDRSSSNQPRSSEP
jgi:sporulation protein YlmC with PRC-barrel domain